MTKTSTGGWGGESNGTDSGWGGNSEQNSSSCNGTGGSRTFDSVTFTARGASRGGRGGFGRKSFGEFSVAAGNCQTKLLLVST